jgi:hypothetical protein
MVRELFSQHIGLPSSYSQAMDSQKSYLLFAYKSAERVISTMNLNPQQTVDLGKQTPSFQLERTAAITERSQVNT